MRNNDNMNISIRDKTQISTFDDVKLILKTMKEEFQKHKQFQQRMRDIYQMRRIGRSKARFSTNENLLD